MTSFNDFAFTMIYSTCYSLTYLIPASLFSLNKCSIYKKRPHSQ